MLDLVQGFEEFSKGEGLSRVPRVRVGSNGFDGLACCALSVIGDVAAYGVGHEAE